MILYANFLVQQPGEVKDKIYANMSCIPARKKHINRA